MQLFLKKVKVYIDKNKNLPNALTLARLLLIPIYWFVYFNLGTNKYIALCIFLVASFTDFLDGYIARKYNLITNFGKLMDPIADKVMVISVFISQYIGGAIPIAPILIIAFKEIVMIIGSIYMLKRNIVVYSNAIGKIGQLLFIVALIASFFNSYFIEINFRLDLILIWLSVIVALVALAIYINNGVKKLKANS